MVPHSVLRGTIQRMSTNLRLSEELAEALRKEAARSGRSQQQIVREAIAKELGLTPAATAMERAIRAGLVKPPTPHREAITPIRLPKGVTTLDLLERDDR